MKNPLLLIALLFIASHIHGQSNDGKILLENSFFQPKTIVELEEGHYFIDFGKAFFGTLQIHPQESQSDSLIIHLGEKLETPNKIDRDPGATIRYRKSTVTSLQANTPVSVTLKPYKRNTSGAAIMLPDSVGAIIPFRYCEIENLKIPIESVKFEQKALHYRFNDDASYFSSSNNIMDSIWEMCKHTIKATSFTGYYIDGDRERIPYEADAYINQLSHYSVDNEYTLARRTNEYFIKNPTWPTEWLLHTVMMFYTDYMYTGDLGPLKKHYESLKLKTLMDLERADGLISSKSPRLTPELILKLGFKKPDTKIKDIIDWPPAQKDTGWKLATAEGERDGYEIVPVNTAVNAFYYHNLVLMGKIADALNKTEDAALFRDKATRVKNAINTKLFNAEKGIYLDGEGSDHSSLHANMLPLAFDLVPQEHVGTVTEFLKSRGMACSVYGAQYLLEGLFKYHEADYAFDLITETNGDRNWWNMIKVGSTMAMEAWDVKYKPNTDWNHAWGTAPLNVITRYLWGIQPKTPGFDIARIQPKMASLTHSEIKTPTKNGTIHATFKRIKNGSFYDIDIPTGMTAEFIVPKSYKKLYVNQKKVKGKPTLIKINSGKSSIKVLD
ncbi:alpha-L-rhamnosidase C-terminal domain-containing protein [Maribacter polysaccharolyticus]|uniref:alpha-L-rhamnosidase-related protein n=1 Tax=Maribacter polysaccharolyticus TaxID=3020831 RepID=UPI00237EFA99|nr:alpha-L-rhamnosidase C-terminal domain-containing protein [Maribacter polysaccharolyticus]MDE3742792.1 family 78 glycoside hydrolase catalytic domain [Maribacter polysaccharolyticus]